MKRLRESNKTIRELVGIARHKGFRITYYVRKDGGVLVKSINGRKFGGSMGNQILRENLGLTISHKRLIANRKLISKYIEKKPISELKGEALIRRVQRDWSIYKPNSSAKITRKKYEYSVKKYGEVEAIRRFIQADKYTRGIAYEKNVDYWIADLERIKNIECHSKRLKDRMDRIINHLKEDKDNILERDLEEVRNIMYNNIQIEDKITNLERLFNIK